jgi:hypothetical protein
MTGDMEVFLEPKKYMWTAPSFRHNTYPGSFRSPETHELGLYLFEEVQKRQKNIERLSTTFRAEDSEEVCSDLFPGPWEVLHLAALGAQNPHSSHRTISFSISRIEHHA